MRLHEINSFSVGDDLLFEMHEYLNGMNLLENNNNVIEYTDFVNQEKLHTYDITLLSKHREYYPIGMQAAPIGEVVFVKYTTDPATYLNSLMGKLYFSINNKTVDFPLTRQMGDGYIDTLIFDSAIDQQQFLTMLNLRFAGWALKVTNI